MSKKEMSRKLNDIGILSMITMFICEIILCISVFIHLLSDTDCITMIVTSTSLWFAGFVTFNIISNNDETEDI